MNVPYNTAIRLLTRREHSAHQLSVKLRQRGFDTALIGQALQQLQQQDLLNDQRFSEMYIRMRTQRGYGPQRIQLELRERGVTDEIISTHLDPTNDKWTQYAIDVWNKKFSQEKTTDYKAQAKQKRFLQQRGFSFEQINAVFNQLDDNQ